jgi:Arc/MetJ family transcription regulator
MENAAIRTNIELDSTLIRQAMKLGRAKTKKEAVYKALREFVETRRDRSILDLAGADLVDPAYVRDLYGSEPETERPRRREPNGTRLKRRSGGKAGR